MDIDAIKSSIITNVYHIDAARKVSLHKHDLTFNQYLLLGFEPLLIQTGSRNQAVEMLRISSY